MKKIIVLFIYITGFSLSIFSLDFNTLVDIAIKNDLLLKQLKLSLNNAILEKKLSEHKPGISVTIGNNTSPALSLSHSFNSNTSSIIFTPYLALKLGYPYLTNLSVTSRLTSTLTPDGPIVSIDPSISLSQPLNDILGITESTELTEKQNLYDIEKAKIAIQNRTTAIKEELLSQIKLIIQTEKELAKNNYLLKVKKDQISTMEKLSNYSKESYEYLVLNNEIKNIERNIKYLKAKLTMLKKELEYIEGTTIDELPQPPTENELPLNYMRPITYIKLQDNPEYRLASIEQEMALLKLKKQTENSLPEYSVGLDYSTAISSPTSKNSTGSNLLREGFSFKLDEISLQVNISQELSTGDINGELSFTWTHSFDNTEEEINTKKLTNNLQIAKLNLKSITRRVNQSVEEINISLAQLINEKLAIKSNLTIAQKQLEQVKEKLNKGLATVDQLEDATWNIKELEYENKLNTIDIYLLGLKREKLFAGD